MGLNIILTDEQKKEKGLYRDIKRKTTIGRWFIENLHPEAIMAWVFAITVISVGLILLYVK